MSLVLRLVLVICAILLVLGAVLGVRKSRMRIEDCVFWVGLSILILILSVFPQIGYLASDAIGFAAPVNFIFAFFILVLTLKCFTMSKRESQLENKIKELTQQIAIERLDHYERRTKGCSPTTYADANEPLAK